MLMSMSRAPDASSRRAASAIAAGSEPTSWAACGSAPSPSARSRASPFSATSSALATISENASAAPNRRAARRMPRSLTPDIGASIGGAGERQRAHTRRRALGA